MKLTPLTNLQRYVLAMVLLNAFTTPMMLSAVNVALPHIARDLNLTAVEISWIPMAYLMASSMFVLIFGRTADSYGRKKIFLLGTVCVIITSGLTAFSNNELSLITGRFLQGWSAAMLYATQIALITSVFHKQQRGQMIGYTIAAIYLGLSIGPLCSGYLIDQYSWRASFVVHIPLALIVLLIAIVKVPQDWLSEQPVSLDIRGTVLYVVSIGLLCVAASALPDITGFACLIISGTGFWWFIQYGCRSNTPIFDFNQFFQNRVFTYSCLASLIMYTATFANVVLVSLFLQYIQGISAAASGGIMMIQPLTMAVLSPLSGRLSDSIEPRNIATVGTFLTAIGLYLLGNLTRSSEFLTIIIALIITGTGFSLFSSPNANAIMSSVKKGHFGSATATMATMRIIGQLTSMILVTLVLNLVLGDAEISQDNIHQLGQAISTTFILSCLLCTGGIYFSLARGKIH